MELFGDFVAPLSNAQSDLGEISAGCSILNADLQMPQLPVWFAVGFLQFLPNFNSVFPCSSAPAGVLSVSTEVVFFFFFSNVTFNKYQYLMEENIYLFFLQNISIFLHFQI